MKTTTIKTSERIQKITTSEITTTNKVEILKVRKKMLTDTPSEYGAVNIGEKYNWFLNVEFKPYVNAEYFYQQMRERIDDEFGCTFSLKKCVTFTSSKIAVYFTKSVYPEFSFLVEEDRKHYKIFLQKVSKSITEEIEELK